MPRRKSGKYQGKNLLQGLRDTLNEEFLKAEHIPYSDKNTLNKEGWLFPKGVSNFTMIIG